MLISGFKKMLRESDEKERVGERERECVCVGEGEKERDMDAKNMSLFWHSWRWRCVTWESASSVSYFSQLLLLLLLLLRDKIKKKTVAENKIEMQHKSSRPLELLPENVKFLLSFFLFYSQFNPNHKRFTLVVKFCRQSAQISNAIKIKLFFEIWNFYFRDSYNGRRRLGGTITITELDLSLWKCCRLQQHVRARPHLPRLHLSCTAEFETNG